MYRKRWIAVFLLLVSALSWATKPLPGWKALEPSDIEALFRDKTLGDGFHYSYRFLSDGSLSGVEMAKGVRGTWARYIEPNLPAPIRPMRTGRPSAWRFWSLA